MSEPLDMTISVSETENLRARHKRWGEECLRLTTPPEWEMWNDLGRALERLEAAERSIEGLLRLSEKCIAEDSSPDLLWLRAAIVTVAVEMRGKVRAQAALAREETPG